MECTICYENINKNTRKKIICPYCEFNCCLICFKKYIIDRKTPNCMSCKHELSLDFISENTPNSFHNKTYRLKRASDLLSQERSLLPTSQHLVEEHKNKILIYGEIKSLQKEEKKLRDNLYIIKNKIHRLKYPRQNNNNTTITATKDRKVFIRACSNEDCRGFLSQAWKCGTCNLYTCSKCHVIKNGKNDPDHECDEDNVATATLLANDTKPCPKCAVLIYKIDGCFGINTPILLWNGKTKMVQHINTGDELVGDDGTKRTVIGLVDGKDKLYRVKQNKGDDYIVNSKHTLVLKFSGSKNIYWNKKGYWSVKWFDKRHKSKTIRVKKDKTKEDAYKEIKKFTDELEVNDPVLITVEEYMKLPKSTKKTLFGFKTEGVFWEHKEVELDPYILGSWLGDGFSRGKGFCSNDMEIVERWKEWAEKNDATVVDCKGKFTYYVRRKKGSKLRSNPLKDLLSKYNLVNNKHIPDEYLINSREVRLQVLAGIIDTDGHVPKENKGRRITIIQANPVLSNQIKFLAQSLGLASTILTRKRQNDTTFTDEPRNYKDQQNINISGKYLAEIPTILPRKKCKDQVACDMLCYVPL